MQDRAQDRAAEVEARTDQQAAAIVLPSFKEVSASVRAYLNWQNAHSRGKNTVDRILKASRSKDVGSISLGPKFDKGPTAEHYYLDSKSRLSFGITLRESSAGCRVVAYRFHLELGTARRPTFYRFDLNDHTHASPLLEPRSHVHPGSDDIRLPFPVLKPLEILDRIFYVIGK
jgi:hypothetical protein